MVGLLIGATGEGMAIETELGMAQQGNLTADQLARMRKDLGNLPPMPRIAETVNTDGRFEMLDSECAIAREGANAKAVRASMKEKEIQNLLRSDGGGQTGFVNGHLSDDMAVRSKPEEK
jgi:hypothetical protein